MSAVPSGRTANLLGALAVAVHDEMTSAVSGAMGRGESAAAALLSIGTRPGTTVGQLSAIVGREHSTTVRTVDRLEADGLVSRDVSSQDARRVELDLTPAGRERFEALRMARHEVLSRRLETLTAAERELLHELLDRLLGTVATSPSDARHVCRFCDHDICRDDRCPVGRPFL